MVGLSETASYFYIGGIIKHARALRNALTNPFGLTSYKRLVPGFEAPVMSALFRAATVRHRLVSLRSHHQKRRRIEVRFPDPSANPYLAAAGVRYGWA